MGSLTAKTSGEIASFMTPAKTNIKSLKVHFNPKQLGTGDPSPDNVREIVGWDGVEVNGSGKNIAHIVGYSATNLDSNNTRKISNNYGTTINTTEFLLPDTELVVTQTQSPNTSNISGYQNGYIAILVDNLIWEQKYNVSFKIEDIISNPLNASLEQNIKLLVPSGRSYNVKRIQDNRLFFNNVEWSPYPNTNVNRRNFEIRICGMSFTLSEFMVTPVDEDDFEYEPYQGNNISTDWYSEIGTVYGGYVDLVSGELVATHMAFTLDGVNHYLGASGVINDNNMALAYGYIGQTDGFSDLPLGLFNSYIYACNKYIIPHSSGQNASVEGVYCGSGNSYIRIALSIDKISDTSSPAKIREGINNWLSKNPIQICYELAEPIIHQLTSTQLSSFIGQNNFWSNADYVEVEYDLIETIDIQKAKQKIILNQPHIETLTSDAVSFTTDMKAPLKECKVYFEPVQEGSGDPSLENVRNITGWDGVSVGLPNEYQEVEYIESDGGQYIDTGLSLDSSDFSLKIIFERNYTSSAEQAIASIWTQSHNYWNMFIRPRSVGNYPIDVYTGQHHEVGNDKNIGTNIDTKYTVELSRNGSQWNCKYDIAEITWTYTPSSVNNTELKLFARGDVQSSSMGHLKMYSCKINIDGVLSGNFIPCYRKSDGEIGMYDTVSKTFYTNSGTGTFLKGDDVNTIIGNIGWSDEVGTIYGGYVDLVKGELVAEWIGKLINSFSWTYNSSGVCFRANADIKRKNNNTISPVKSDIYKTTNVYNSISYWVNVDDFSISEHIGSNTQSEQVNSIHIKDSRYTTVSDFLNGVGNEFIIYELAEPIHYSLTPQQLLTLKGTNNIWSNSNGQTEVKFWTH